jgi:hypothetical protein
LAFPVSLASWIEALAKDPERRAKAFHIVWLASLGMVALGYILIARHYWGRLPW